MTEQKLCVSDERYYEVLFHELIQAPATRAASIAKRTWEAGRDSDHANISKEELIAEMGAAFLSTQCGISQATIDDSAAYIGAWIKHLRADPNWSSTRLAKPRKPSIGSLAHPMLSALDSDTARPLRSRAERSSRLLKTVSPTVVHGTRK